MSAISSYHRKDGRQATELRGKELKLSELTQFDGSSWYAQGLTSVAVTVHGPTLAKQENYRECDVAVRVMNGFEEHPMAGGADRLGQRERRRIQANERDAYQIEMLVEKCIHAVFLKERFPRCVLAVDVLLFHDGGSLPAVAMNAVMTALLDAGVPCRTTVAAVSVALLNTVSIDAASSSSSALSSSSSSSPSSKAGAVCAPPRRDFLLDPTDAEEQLCVVDLSSTATSTVGEKRPRDGTEHATTTTTTSTPAQSTTATSKTFLRRETVACGTFVFSNPNCGGGVLASHLRRVAARPAIDSKSGVAVATSTTGEVLSKAPSVSVDELTEMTKLAERAAPFVFDLFRQCNVPL